RMSAERDRRTKLVRAPAPRESHSRSAPRGPSFRKNGRIDETERRCSRANGGDVSPCDCRLSILYLEGALGATELGGRYANNNCCSKDENGSVGRRGFFASTR